LFFEIVKGQGALVENRFKAGMLRPPAPKRF